MSESTKAVSHEPEARGTDILSKEIKPYFQPIIAADSNKIYSYEVLGRYIDGGSVKSLGHFFSSVSSEKALKADRIIRKDALERFAREGNGEYLFINMRLNWIARYADRPEELPTIRWAKEFGIDPCKLVIEITEEEFCDDNEAFAKVIAYYKNAGCRIAIDDYGKKASHIDRLALLSPDIMKIDMSYIHRCEASYHYREYLKTLTSFAEQVGIEVLYEGIETQKQLDICIASKGRLYQGFLLAEPQPSIRNAVANHEIFSTSTEQFIKSFQDFSGSVKIRRELWDSRIEGFFSKNEIPCSATGINDYLSKLCLELSAHVKKAYLCNRHGDQLSYNIEVDSGEIVWGDYRNRNWAWRCFFRRLWYHWTRVRKAI